MLSRSGQDHDPAGEGLDRSCLGRPRPNSRFESGLGPPTAGDRPARRHRDGGFQAVRRCLDDDHPPPANRAHTANRPPSVAAGVATARGPSSTPTARCRTQPERETTAGPSSTPTARRRRGTDRCEAPRPPPEEGSGGTGIGPFGLRRLAARRCLFKDRPGAGRRWSRSTDHAADTVIPALFAALTGRQAPPGPTAAPRPAAPPRPRPRARRRCRQPRRLHPPLPR